MKCDVCCKSVDPETGTENTAFAICETCWTGGQPANKNSPTRVFPWDLFAAAALFRGASAHGAAEIADLMMTERAKRRA